jgi:hypothetical protein
MAVVANLDRREEILDAAVRVELDEMRRAPPWAFYAPRSREWFEGEVDRLLQEKGEAAARAQEARIRDLQERELRLRLDAEEQPRPRRQS